MVDKERDVINQLSEECAICELKKKEGIHLYNIFLCPECENILIQTEVNDPLYEQHMEKLRKMNLSGIYT